jgi:hypothetical protein
MAGSEYETSGMPKSTDGDPEDQKEAQRAADGLKGQIAALRNQVRQAQAELREALRRKRETRSFEDKD